jgi:hypothetical protein
MRYWVVLFDRDGGESDPEGPFDCQSDAQSCGEFAVDCWQWVSYVIQKEQDDD